MTNRTLAITLGLIGWALAYAIAKSRTRVAQRDIRLRRKQLTTWEGEGGNLPPPPSSSAITTTQANPY